MGGSGVKELQKYTRSSYIDSLKKQPTFCDSTTGFPHEMMPEKQVQKFHTNEASVPRSG